MKKAEKTGKKIVLTPRDSMLDIFFKQIRKYPVLTPEATHEAFVRMHAGDEKARLLLINSNMRLVVRYAKTFSSQIHNLLENISAGLQGLINAVDKYDYKRGASFASCAKPYIEKAIKENLAEVMSPVHLPDNHRKDYSKVQKVLTKNAEHPGDDFYYSYEDIAHLTGLTVERVKRAFLDHVVSVSYDEPVYDHDGMATPRLDLLADRSLPSHEAVFESADMYEGLRQLIMKKVEAKSANVFIDSALNNHLTKTELAEKYNMTIDQLVRTIKRVNSILVKDHSIKEYAKAAGYC